MKLLARKVLFVGLLVLVAGNANRILDRWFAEEPVGWVVAFSDLLMLVGLLLALEGLWKNLAHHRSAREEAANGDTGAEVLRREARARELRGRSW